MNTPPIHLIIESELLFLLELLASADGITAMDSAPHPYDRKPFPDGGKWRGAIPRHLVRLGIIQAVDTDTGSRTAGYAKRKTRRKSWLAYWRLINRPAAERRIVLLQALLTRRNRTLFDEA